MNKCPNCGKEFEGKFCPDCGAEWQEEKTCPKCGAKLNGSAKFCNECGYSFENTTKKPNKKISVLDWIKSHLKIVIPVALAVVLIIVLACSIPACIAAQTNGTYYKLNPDGELDKKTYFILSSGKWEDEDGEKGTYKKEGDKIIFLVEFFGETEELCDGTVKDGVLKIKDPLGMGTEDTYISEKHEHKFGEWETTREATCTKDGTSTRTCDCGVKETNPIPATGVHNYVWQITKEATCTREGSKDYVCTGCRDIQQTEEIEMLAHTYGEWEVTKEPTCTEAGSKNRTCTVCKNKDTQTIDKLPHTYGNWEITTEATCTASGSQKHTCTVCNNSETQTIALLGHDFQNNICTLCKEYALKLTLSSDNKYYSVTSNNINSKTELTIPSSYNELPITSIGDEAFRGCSELTSVSIGNGVTSIGYSAFRGCSGLTSVSIPDSVTEIGNSAFQGCSGLTSVSIPDSVTSIGNSAFYGCSGLTSISIPDSVTKIYNNAFNGTAYFNKGSNWKDKVLYIGKHLIDVKTGITGNYVIKQGTLTIAGHAFYDCNELTSITIPDGVTSIGEGAFYKCKGLTSVSIPDSVTSIGEGAFYDCNELTSITIPDGVTSIGRYAFAYCNRLTSVSIPDSVTEIGYGAFEDCSRLTDINFKGTKEQWKAIKKDYFWNYNTGDYTVHCTDGDIKS